MDFGNHRRPINNGGEPYGSSHLLQQRREIERAIYMERKHMFAGFEDERPQEQDYGQFHIYLVNRDHLHWAIKTLDGSKLPARLEGVWTHIDRAKHEIDALANFKPKEIA